MYGYANTYVYVTTTKKETTHLNEHKEGGVNGELGGGEKRGDIM